jgi:hypothetical protein
MRSKDKIILLRIAFSPSPSGFEKIHVAKRDGHGGNVLWDDSNIAVKELEDMDLKIVDLYM